MKQLLLLNVKGGVQILTTVALWSCRNAKPRTASTNVTKRVEYPCRIANFALFVHHQLSLSFIKFADISQECTRSSALCSSATDYDHKIL